VFHTESTKAASSGRVSCLIGVSSLILKTSEDQKRPSRGLSFACSTPNYQQRIISRPRWVDRIEKVWDVANTNRTSN